jgi:hypothetical protein
MFRAHLVSHMCHRARASHWLPRRVTPHRLPFRLPCSVYHVTSTMYVCHSVCRSVYLADCLKFLLFLQGLFNPSQGTANCIIFVWTSPTYRKSMYQLIRRMCTCKGLFGRGTGGGGSQYNTSLMGRTEEGDRGDYPPMGRTGGSERGGHTGRARTSTGAFHQDGQSETLSWSSSVEQYGTPYGTTPYGTDESNTFDNPSAGPIDSDLAAVQASLNAPGAQGLTPVTPAGAAEANAKARGGEAGQDITPVSDLDLAAISEGTEGAPRGGTSGGGDRGSGGSGGGDATRGAERAHSSNSKDMPSRQVLQLRGWINSSSPAAMERSVSDTNVSSVGQGGVLYRLTGANLRALEDSLGAEAEGLIWMPPPSAGGDLYESRP